MDDAVTIEGSTNGDGGRLAVPNYRVLLKPVSGRYCNVVVRSI